MKYSSLFKKLVYVILFINILFSEYIPDDILKNIQNNRDWRLIEYESLNWNGFDWFDSRLITFSYNNDDIIEILIESESFNIRLIFTYNNQNNLIQVLHQYKYSDDYEWNDFHRDLMTYDEDSHLIETLHQDWNENNWVNDELELFTYDNDILIQGIEQIWIDIDNDWENSHLILYTYNQDNLLVEKSLTNWYQNSWNENVHNYYYYTYDDNNNLIQEMYQNSGVDTVREIYTYDENNNQIEWIEQRWVEEFWDNESLNTNYVYENYVNSCPDNIEGDLNYDGIVNIIDIVDMVNCILSNNRCDICFDISGDGFVDVVDIVDLVNIILDN